MIYNLCNLHLKAASKTTIWVKSAKGSLIQFDGFQWKERDLFVYTLAKPDKRNRVPYII